MQNIHNILNIGFRELKNSLIKNPKLDAEVLLSHVLNKSLKEMNSIETAGTAENIAAIKH